MVNNDDLAHALGALGILLGVVALTAGRRRLALAAALGLVAGALVLTKLSAAPLAPALLFAAIAAAPGARLRLAAVFAGAAALVCGWWLVANQVRYGDPLASEESRSYLRVLAPHLFSTDPPLEQAFVTVPRSLWTSWWYTSGWNQFRWDWEFYVPFWLGLLGGLAALVVPRGRALAVPRGGLKFLGLALAGVLATLWIVGMDTTTMQGRLGFYGLGAVAILFALGLERARVPAAARFALPLLGLVATVIAIRSDVLGVFN